jgi:hypothetical protein
VRDTIKTNWITQGIKISSKKMRLLAQPEEDDSYEKEGFM